MKTKILYTVALDKAGALVKAKNAEKGNEFNCPICKEELILKKSGKTGKGSKRPHFAHRALTLNCTPETALHFNFKNLLADKIQQNIEKGIHLPIKWECEHCYETHIGNLLKKAKSVKVEYNMTFCQPDIALLDIDDKVFAVIEIVVTHKPEEKVLNFYKEKNIILIQINLTSDLDLENIDSKISKPDIVNFCYNPKCEKCKHHQQKTKMIIIAGDCWRCDSTIKVAVVKGDGDRGTSGASTFSIEEIELAKSKGVLLKEHYSATMKEKYLASTCSSCGTFVGEFNLISQYVSPAEFGDFSSETIDIGYHCDNCYKISQDNE